MGVSAEVNPYLDTAFPNGGLITKMTYPGGAVHEFSYQQHLGRLSGIEEGADLASLTPFVTGLEYNKAGVVTAMDYSNLTRQEWSFDNRKRIYKKEAGSSSKSLFAEYTYDANGNTVSRTIHMDENTSRTISFSYDTLNRLVATTEDAKVTRYYYDNAGNRFIKESPDETTVYLRHGQLAVAIEIIIPVDTSAKKGEVSRYILSGDLIAGRVTTTVDPNDAGFTASDSIARSWYHLDHLNSTKLTTDESGASEVQYIYRAFGEQLRKLGEEDATYTYSGKELDGVTNLYYFNARYYDATTGRFINVDPVQDGLNWYVYCSNNPLKFVDPTGLADILSRAINSGVTFNYNVANFLGESFPGWRAVRHSLVVVNKSNTNNDVYHYVGKSGGIGYSDEYAIQKGNNKYRIIYSGLDDDLAEQASLNVINSEQFGGGDNEKAKQLYKIFKNDCNDFTEAVITEYEKLWRAQQNVDDVDSAWAEHYSAITQERNVEVIYNSIEKNDVQVAEEAEPVVIPWPNRSYFY